MKGPRPDRGFSEKMLASMKTELTLKMSKLEPEANRERSF